MCRPRGGVVTRRGLLLFYFHGEKRLCLAMKEIGEPSGTLETFLRNTIMTMPARRMLKRDVKMIHLMHVIANVLREFLA